MPSKAEERWKRLAARGAKGVIPTPEGDTFPRMCTLPGRLAASATKVGCPFRPERPFSLYAANSLH
jgi:hypothetical protein